MDGVRWLLAHTDVGESVVAARPSSLIRSPHRQMMDETPVSSGFDSCQVDLQSRRVCTGGRVIGG